MKKSNNAFTMIEMIFVIVVLGILASIAIPKLAATRDDATVTKGIADIASIRSAIVSERQSRLIRGDSDWISRLSTGTAGDNLFTGVDVNQTLLMYGVPVGEWAQGAVTATTDTYTFTVGGTTVTFTYTNTGTAGGTFTCDTTAGTTAQQDLCAELIN